MEEKLFDLLFEACDDRIIYRDKNIDLFETGLLDSMGFIELLMTLEEEFDIEIPVEDMEGLQTVGAVVDYLQGRGVEL